MRSRGHLGYFVSLKALQENKHLFPTKEGYFLYSELNMFPIVSGARAEQVTHAFHLTDSKESVGRSGLAEIEYPPHERFIVVLFVLMVN